MATKIHLKKDYSYNWVKNNPVLDAGEPGFEIDTGILKIGNGDARWLDLDGYAPGSSLHEDFAELLEEHVNSLTPHPAYDDPPVNFTILFENSLA